MKLTNIKKIISGAASAMMIVSSVPFTASAADQQQRGNVGGFDYEMWNQNGQGQVSMQPSAGSFTCSWSNIENFLARMGKNYDSQKKNYKAFGDIVLSYDVEYTPKGNSYMCVYGWTRNPLMEYYIVEGWGDWRPPGDGAEKKGTVTLNGNTYDIAKTMRYNQPSLDGTATFPQYWSIRQTSGSRNNTTNYMKGTISVSKHFDAWSQAGLDMSGTLYEVSLNIEGYRSNGSANVKSISFGDTEPDPVPVTPAEPLKADENGYYFTEKFENGAGDWVGRGNATVEATSGGYDGSKGLFVSERTAEWNGASIALDENTFKAGETYSFGVSVKPETSTTMKLTLQYTDSSGTENYDKVAEAAASADDWNDLSNTSYTIPSGAKNLILYVEAPDSFTDFYIDNAFGAVKNTPPLVDTGTHTIEVPNTQQPSSKGLRGDTNSDGIIDVFDLAPLRRGILNMMSGAGSPPANSDVNGDGTVNVADLVCLQQYLLGAEKLPEPVTTTTTTTVTTTAAKVTTTTTTSGGNNASVNLNSKIRNDMPTTVPGGNEKSGACKVEKKTYNCKFTGGQKSCNVVLPPNYDASKQYPVMYVLHGIGGDENSMVSGMGVQELLAGLIGNGKAEEMIIVLPSQFTSKNGNGGGGFGINQETCEAYDNFLYDISDSLIPFIEANYPVKTGRENRAITGFSMGGREAIYIGLMRPDLFAYVGGACPAPGITPGSDMFMTHPGCMQESEMKFRDVGPEPAVFMITGGTNDSVVGTFPKQYSDILTRNGVDHVYQSIPGGSHGADSVKPHLYTFMRYAFK